MIHFKYLLFSKIYLITAVLLISVQGNAQVQPDSLQADIYYLKADSVGKYLKYDEAIEYLEKASEIYKYYDNKEMYMNSKFVQIYYLNMKGYDFNFIDNIKKIFFESKDYLGPDNELEAEGYLQIGVYNLRNGFAQKGISYFYRVLEIYNKTPRINYIKRRYLFGQIGEAYSSVNLDSTLFYFKKSRDLATTNEGEYSMLTASANRGLAYAYKRRKDYNKALSYYLKSLRIYKEKNELFYLAVTLNLIGKLYLEIGSNQKAKVYLDRALKLLKKDTSRKQDKKNYNYRSVYNNLSTYYLRSRDLEKALLYSQKSIYAHLSEKPPTDSFVFPQLENEAIMFKGRLIKSFLLKIEILKEFRKVKPKNSKLSEQILEHYRITIELFANIKFSHASNFQDKIRLDEEYINIYQGAIETAWHLYTLTNDKKYLKLAFTFSENKKAFTLLENLNKTEAKELGGIPQHFLQKESQLKKEISQTKTEINKGGEKTQYFKKHLIKLELQHDSILYIYETQYPNYYELFKKQKNIDIDHIQENLTPNTTLIEYFKGDTSLYVFVINKDVFEAKKLSLNSSLSDQIQNLNNCLKNCKSEEFSERAHELYKVLFEPIAHLIKGNKVIIIPDDHLWNLSFDMLVTAPNLNGNFQQLDYLIKKYTISYAYSANLFLKQSNNKISNKILECLAFSFEGKENEFIGKKLALRSLRNTELIDLPGSRKEIASVAKFLDGTYYYGQQASEKNFKSFAKDYSVLHLAVHGEVDGTNPMNSKLYFTSSQDSIEDNFLHAYELYNMNLNSEMVVLSACNTGSGKLEKGEGVMSLGRAFTYAGCKSVIMSQWKLSDYSTPIIMESFYKHLDGGKSKDEALRNAKLEYLSNTYNLNSKPNLWAGLVLIGDTSAIKKSGNKMLFVSIGVVLLLSSIFYLKYYPKKY